MKNETQLSENELLWLCGFIDLEREDTYRHTQEDRKELRKILKKLRRLKTRWNTKQETSLYQ